jgi:hypothetical protein
MDKNTVVSVGTMAGEFIGKFREFTADGQVVLDDPRVIMQTNAQGGLGFAKSLCVTGEVDPKEVTLKDYIFVTKSNKDVATEYRTLISGIIL